MKVRTVALTALLLMFAVPAWAQTAPADDFRQNCLSCHTVGGGRLTGPDLKDVIQRKDREWLVRFVQDPKTMMESGDPYAQKLLQDARGVLMPTVAGMTPARARALLDLIEQESKLPKSQFMGTQLSDRPFTPQDVELGRDLFLGRRRLASRSPSCVSCHTVNGIGGLGGGRLGPDLTLVWERLQGRKGLGAWLSNPASPTMAPVYKGKTMQAEEILPLLAYFENTAQKGGKADSVPLLNFLLLGLGGMIVGLVSIDLIWTNRLRGVRRELVQRVSKRGQA
jgi:mono/diheme cytochrome c family protein